MAANSQIGKYGWFSQLKINIKWSVTFGENYEFIVGTDHIYLLKH